MHKRGSIFGWSASCRTAGSIIGSVFGGYVVCCLGIRRIFYIAGMIFFVLLPVFKAELLLLQEAIEKYARGFSKVSVRPSGRTGELTSSVNSAPALRGKICDFAYVALSLRAGSLRRAGRFAPAPRPAGCRCR